MSELLVTVLRLSYLILLWLLVLSAIGVLRRDIFGTKVVQRGRKPAPRPAPREPSKAAVVGQPGPPPRQRISGAGAGVAVAPSGPEPRASARLAVTEGAIAGTTVPLASSAVLIGRGPMCTVVLDDDYASTRHARVFPQQGGWWVEDLGSTNGTYIDGERIAEPRELKPGVPVRIGQTVFELQG